MKNDSTKKRIVFVVYNLAFISNWIEKLLPYISHGEFYIFHIGKLQKMSPKTLPDVNYLDCSNLSGPAIRKAVVAIKPNVCVVFNFRSLYEQLLMRICKNVGVRTVYLEHGLVSMNTTKFKKNKIKEAFRNTAYRQLNFLYKYAGYLLSCKAIMREFGIFINVYFRGCFRMSPFDHYYLYSQRSVEKFSSIFDLKDGKCYTLVGYPIFNNQQQKEESSLFIGSGRGALYVHQPFISDKFTSISYEEEKDYLLKLANILKPRYGSFIVLLHPRENLSVYRKRFEGTGIDIIQSPNNYKSFADKDLIIGHYSTALLYALYFNKPTVIIDYPHARLDSIFSGYFDYIDDITKLATYDFGISKHPRTYLVGSQNTYENIAKKMFKESL